MYRMMVLARRFEERVNLLFVSSEVPGTVHLYTGQEAVAVGVCLAIRPDDWITSTHRPHGHAVAKGIPVRELMAELFARTTGCCRGYGGSMHVGDMAYGMLPAIAIVGGNIPVAAGLALACKRLANGKVVACFFGDGASSEGAFHEGVNMAAIWDLPVVFVCENNLYGASTHVKRVMRVEHVADRAAAYGIPGVTVDGMDVVAVHDAVAEAADRARSGMGPALVECETYRFVGHSRTDPGLYRTKEEVEYFKSRDSIKCLRARVADAGMATEDEFTEIDQSVERELEEAIEFARKSPHPLPEDCLKHVFVGKEG
ncbi:MAG: pyruvate dehydrogenase (acetyl-transferring) E1 component subunit alpha [Armatimonadetes bacterium RBG_16_58_9]|nr:MAG: pyruvate dehydrogenase (acetyl-transferring) E1 component subunit alpha [Armatimonadetes bacterium RBG_16_58_9]